MNRNKQVSFFQKAKMLHIPKWLKDNIQIYRLQEESRWHGACSISKKKQALLHVFTPLDYNSIMRSFPSVKPCASAYPHTLRILMGFCLVPTLTTIGLSNHVTFSPTPSAATPQLLLTSRFLPPMLLWCRLPITLRF